MREDLAEESQRGGGGAAKAFRFACIIMNRAAGPIISDATARAETEMLFYAPGDFLFSGVLYANIFFTGTTDKACMYPFVNLFTGFFSGFRIYFR